MFRRILAVAGLCCGSSAAWALDIQESTFQVEFSRGGEKLVHTDTTVPYLPGNACYYWYIRVDPATAGDFTLLETLTMPEPIAGWIDYQNDPLAVTQVMEGGQGAITTVRQTPDENGWVGHGWCLSEGDPKGRHHISVVFGELEIAAWDFDIVSEADYNFVAPAAEATPEIMVDSPIRIPRPPGVPQPPRPPGS